MGLFKTFIETKDNSGNTQFEKIAERSGGSKIFAIETSGNEITFDNNRYYGTLSNPLTALTLNLTGAKIGAVSVVFFNGTDLPTFVDYWANEDDVYYEVLTDPNEVWQLTLVYEVGGLIRGSLNKMKQ